MAEKVTIHEVLEPIANWYGGGTEGNRSDLDIIIDVVSDLQKDRAEVLIQKERIKKLEIEETAAVKHPIDSEGKMNLGVNYCYYCGQCVKDQKYCHHCGRKLLWPSKP